MLLVQTEKYKLKVPTDTCAWPADRAERIGVNSYGIGGANAHVSPTGMDISSRINVCHGGKSKVLCGHDTMFRRVILIIVWNADEQKWYYVKRQEPEDVLLLKIFDSNDLQSGGQAEYTPHTGVDDLHGADGPETPRESIEVRAVVCYA